MPCNTPLNYVHFSFRDRLHTDYRSSSKAKISRRKEEAAIEPSVKDFDEFMAQDPLPLSSPLDVQNTRRREIALLEEDSRKPGKEWNCSMHVICVHPLLQ